MDTVRDRSCMKKPFRLVPSVGFCAAYATWTSAWLDLGVGVEICSLLGAWPSPATMADMVEGVEVEDIAVCDYRRYASSWKNGSCCWATSRDSSPCLYVLRLLGSDYKPSTRRHDIDVMLS